MQMGGYCTALITKLVAGLKKALCRQETQLVQQLRTGTVIALDAQ